MPRKEPATITVAKITVIGTIVVAAFGLIGSLITKVLNPSTPDTSQEFIGRVIDADTQFSISGAKVTLEFEGVPIVVYTDSNGTYRFNVIVSKPTGGQITIEAEGYQPYLRIINLSPDANSIITVRLIPIDPTSTPQPFPSSTFIPEPTATITSTATITPTATSTPLKMKSIADGCIFARTWKADSTNSSQASEITEKTDGCYDTGSLGVFANRSGVLQILDNNNRAQVSSGIFMPVYSDSIIEFRVHVNLMYIVTPGTLTYVNFAVAPAGDPMFTKNTARFKIQVEDTQNDPFIYFVLADTGENNGARLTNQHYEYGRTYTIRLELVGSIMNVFINNIKQNESPTIPAGAKVFYIGYNLPAAAGIDAEVTNIKVDGVAR